MNAVDITILAILALSTLFGLMRGFIAAVVSLGTWCAAFVVAWLFGDSVAVLYAPILHAHWAQLFAGYLTCFAGILLIGALLGLMLRTLIIGSGLSGGDRLLGMLFGFARGVLLVIAIVMVLGFTPLPRQSWWQRSQLLPTFVESADTLAQYLPDSARQYLELGSHALPDISQVRLPKLPGNAQHYFDKLHNPSLLPHWPPGNSSTPPAPAASQTRAGH